MPDDPKPEPGTGGVQKGKRYMLYDGMIHAGGTRAWRNNNPGNIEAGKFAQSQGAIGSDGRFAVFPNYNAGRTALESSLRADAAQNLTVGQVVQRHAPHFVDTACAELGVVAATLLTALSAAQFSSFVDIIQKVEGWEEGDMIPQSEASPTWAQRLFYLVSGGS